MNINTNYLCITLLIFSLFWVSCKSTQQLPNDYPKTQIQIGNGGGFAGAINQYAIYENGDVYYNNEIEENYSKIGKLDKNIVFQLLSNYTLLGLNEVVLKEPGNVYRYINYVSGGKEHKVLWGKRPPLNKNVETFYNNILNSVKGLAD